MDILDRDYQDGAFERRTGISHADIALLLKQPLFVGFSSSDAKHLLSKASMREYARNATLFNYGEQADRLFVVMTGGIKLYHDSANGQESVIAICQPGDSIGEAAVIQLKAYPVNATAIERTKLLIIPAADFLKKMEKNEQLNANVMAVMSARLLQLVHVVEQRSGRSSVARLADFLLEIAPQDQEAALVHLPMDKAVIAANLGMQPETFSRSLAKLRDHGVETNGNDVMIADLAALRRLTDG
ncbi:MAG: Crp/Fnr family transcriptional regulator [Fimbriimonadaceae bacterium]|nr:Crp/Fnr family transcriptional regulator [Alphaproteobacteria bacterium]